MDMSSRLVDTPETHDPSVEIMETRAVWVRRVVAAGFLAALVLAPKLWLNDEFYGPVSILGEWPQLIFPLDWMFFLVIGGLLVPIALSSRWGKWIAIWSAVVFLRAIWDRMIWQPYFYQYFFMLVLLGWGGEGWPTWRTSTRRKRGSRSPAVSPGVGLNACRIVMAGIYFWSGISKFNHRFLHGGARHLLLPLCPVWVVEIIEPFGWGIALMEVVIGVGMVFSSTRLPAAVMAALMHVGILLSIGPTGINYNAVVWPWNITMIVLLGLLFWRGSDNMTGMAFAPAHRRRSIVATVFFLLLPGLSYLGFWPYYVSFRLYSGMSRDAWVFVSDDLKQRLPEDVQSELRPVSRGQLDWRLRLNHWSEGRLGAFAPPERRIYLHVADRFCQFAEGPHEFGMKINSQPDFWSGKTQAELFRCGDL